MPMDFLRRVLGVGPTRPSAPRNHPASAAPKAAAPERLTRPDLEALAALPGVGLTMAERLSAAGYPDTKSLANARVEDLTAIPGIGPTTASRIMRHLENPEATPPKRPRAPLDADGQPPPAVNARMRSGRSTTELIGLVKGIMADDAVSEEEFRLLHDWFHANPEAADSWPGDTIMAMIQDIVADGVVTTDEVSDLAHLLRKVTGGDGGLVAGHNAPTTLPLDTPPPPLTFTGQVYVFTGACAFGPRRACEEVVAELGGYCERNVTRRTNVLVIGTLASRDWAQTSYGRKIEKAVEYRDRGVPIAIVSEDHWVEAVG